MDDAKEFEDTQKSMKLLGFCKQQSWVFKTVAAILHLGSIRFKSCRKEMRTDVKSSLGNVWNELIFWGSRGESEKAVTYRSITIGRKKTMIPLNPLKLWMLTHCPRVFTIVCFCG